jgi:TonB-dependent SusC/RagA subfamily outer membrane receptor
MDTTLRSPLGLSAVVLLCLGVSDIVAQEPGVVHGSVREAASDAPLVGVTVSVEGTAINASTDGNGRYRLINLAAGTYRLRVERLGYATLVDEVAVYPGRMTVAHFRLPVLTVLLDSLVVAGRQPVGPRRKAKEISLPETVPVASLGDALDAATPGLEVRRGSGQVGSGIRIRLRGARSVSVPGHPLVYIDGIRVEYATGSPWLGLVGPSIFDLVNPAEIERIEVLRGAEATAYGLGSVNGVILITTKGRD